MLEKRDNYDVIIGYYALMRNGLVICDGEACIIAGSYKTMKNYLTSSKNKPPSKVKIRKTCFGEIITGMNRGGAYSFDSESYLKFQPLAREEGLNFDDVDFTPDTPGEVKFLTIELTNS